MLPVRQVLFAVLLAQCLLRCGAQRTRPRRQTVTTVTTVTTVSASIGAKSASPTSSPAKLTSSTWASKSTVSTVSTAAKTTQSNSTAAVKLSSADAAISGQFPCRVSSSEMNSGHFALRDCVLTSSWPQVALLATDRNRKFSLVLREVRVQDASGWNRWVRQLKNSSFELHFAFSMKGSAMVDTESLPFGNDFLSLQVSNLDWNQTQVLQIAKQSKLSVRECRLVNVSLSEIPKLPWTVTSTLSFKSNNIAVIKRGDFDSFNLTTLEYLELVDNPLYFVDFDAFAWYVQNHPTIYMPDYVEQSISSFEAYVEQALSSHFNGSQRSALLCCDSLDTCLIETFNVTPDYQLPECPDPPTVIARSAASHSSALAAVYVAFAAALVLLAAIAFLAVRRGTRCFAISRFPRLPAMESLDDHELLSDDAAE